MLTFTHRLIVEFFILLIILWHQSIEESKALLKMYNTSAFCQRNIARIDGEHGQICKLSAARTGLLTLFSAQLRCREGKYRGRANWQKRGVFSISIAKVRHELRVLNFAATFVAWLRIMYLTFRFVHGPDFSTKIMKNVKFILFLATSKYI